MTQLQAQKALETQPEVQKLTSFHAQSFQSVLDLLGHDGILFLAATTHRIQQMVLSLAAPLFGALQSVWL